MPVSINHPTGSTVAPPPAPSTPETTPQPVPNAPTGNPAPAPKFQGNPPQQQLRKLTGGGAR